MNVDESRALAYQRLMRADVRLEAVRQRVAPGTKPMTHWVDPAELDREQDLYLATLARYVACLGGRIEVRAVFAGEAVTLLALPEDDG
jgi:hypothetical protein